MIYIADKYAQAVDAALNATFAELDMPPLTMVRIIANVPDEMSDMTPEEMALHYLLNEHAEKEVRP